MTVLKTVLVFGLLLVSVAACSTRPTPPESAQEADGTVVAPKPHYKVGSPYQVDGIWYFPEEDYEYDQVGLASWYGPGFHGRLTANGERYNQYDMTAAHKTLPLPSYVRVTNLDTGARVVVRLNDRGPFAEGRIIDLSRRAAERLGIVQAGLAPVRVTLLANESRRIAALLRAGKPSAEAIRLSEPTDMTAPSGLGTDPVRSSGPVRTAPRRFYVQAGAFGDVRNAHRLHAKLVALGPTDIRHTRRGDGHVYRVVIGPFTSLAKAQAALAGARAAGGEDARLLAEPERPFTLTAADGMR